MSAQLESAMTAIFAAKEVDVKKGLLVRKAELRSRQAAHKLEQAVEAYNMALAEQIIQALVAEGLGLCQTSYSDFHIAKEAGMMGIIRTGTVTRGDHYYEHDEPYVDTKLKCKECRANITIRRGSDSLVELDARAHWTKMLRNRLQPRNAYEHYLKELLVWAAEHGITEQPIRQEYSGSKASFRLGGVPLDLSQDSLILP